ncbi:MAG: MBL fold metallo-hydrolase [Anaerolineae bacterium]|nr:MBL fold metallo-hydrolase [Anaerolineae bacterium]
MTKRNIIVGGTVVIIAVLAIGLLFLRSNGVEGALRRTIINNQDQASETADELQRTDRITIVLVGTGSPLAQAGPQTSTAVFVNGQFLLFDAGNNTLDVMNSLNFPLDELDAVFITHFHNDHYADLGDVMEWSWIWGRRKILPVYGPTGITQIVDGFQAAYELEESYRTAHHGEELMPPQWAPSEPIEFEPPTDDSAIVIYERDEVTVKAFRVNHAPVEPSVGYRIEYAGKVIVLSGDTVRTTSLLQHSRNADLLVAEAMNKRVVETIEDINRELGYEDQASLLFDIRDYHMDVSDVGALAQEANVQHLALNHLAPKPQGTSQANRLFRDPVRESYTGEISVGKDGMQIVIPVP